MKTEEKHIQNIEFLGKVKDWEGWSKNILATEKWKGYQQKKNMIEQLEV